MSEDCHDSNICCPTCLSGQPTLRLLVYDRTGSVAQPCSDNWHWTAASEATKLARMRSELVKWAGYSGKTSRADYDPSRLVLTPSDRKWLRGMKIRVDADSIFVNDSENGWRLRYRDDA